MILAIALVATLAWGLYSLVCLAQNIQRTRTIGIPYLIVPVSPLNTLWIVFEPIIFFFVDLLPFQLGSVNVYGRRGWHFPDKAQSHMRLGDAWAIVTPVDIYIYLCDREAINDIFARRPDFARPTELYQLLAVFGRNVSTVEWVDWQRQRKIVAAPFNENTNSYVWTESLSQAQGMIRSFASAGVSGAYGLGRDTRTLALNVLAATGFRRSYDFRSAMDTGKDEARTYRESLSTVMDNTFIVMLLPSWLLKLPVFPKWLQHVGECMEDFKQYMLKMYNTEKSLLDEGKPGTGNLMSSLVRESSDEIKGNRVSLTLDEILGNIYVINFAGHDTTANSLAYSILLLAAYPEVQEWIAQEIREIFKDEDRESWNYKEAFPKLKRSYSILLETIRLYPPIMALPKRVVHTTATVKLGDTKRTLTLPQGAMIIPSVLATHTHPKYWPDEPLLWHPQRWISQTSGDTLSEHLEKEEIFTPLEGTYFPWSHGPQSCPGKKFSQVEFVAALSCLFREHRVRIPLQKGEDFEAARARLLAVAEDSQQTLLLRMRDSDSLRLIWERVE